jgi:4'-phosphopantetheinyl transferase
MARGEHEIPEAETWLSTAEVDRAATLRFTKRRTEYLLRRWVCKRAVAAAVGMPDDLASLARIEVANHPSGAPFVRVDGASSPLDVSITDRAGWGICLVGEQRGRVGCDLEIVEPRSAGFVADFLTEAEQEYVATRPGDEAHAAANLLWSAKESALKVLQTGLRRDTRSVEVAVAEPGEEGGRGTGWGRLEIRAVEGLQMTGWWRREGVFLLTVASEQPLPPPTPLVGSVDLTGAQPAHSWLDRPLSS